MKVKGRNKRNKYKPFHLKTFFYKENNRKGKGKKDGEMKERGWKGFEEEFWEG